MRQSLGTSVHQWLSLSLCITSLLLPYISVNTQTTIFVFYLVDYMSTFAIVKSDGEMLNFEENRFCKRILLFCGSAKHVYLATFFFLYCMTIFKSRINWIATSPQSFRCRIMYSFQSNNIRLTFTPSCDGWIYLFKVKYCAGNFLSLWWTPKDERTKGNTQWEAALIVSLFVREGFG